MAPCDKTLKTFVVQDFYNQTQSLKVRKMFHLHTCIYFCSFIGMSLFVGVPSILPENWNGSIGVPVTLQGQRLLTH